jgi:hypothetical protein
VLALEVVQEFAEAVRPEILGADVQIRNDGDTHGPHHILPRGTVGGPAAAGPNDSVRLKSNVGER